ncbi:hypothetical protein PSTT_07772 [Puccinia striiformis]|uniref:Reverse transcriptase domain-containing protein n=1 Tax=Puccinia striiformis TaxID=27350 RepID=A0A2S4VF55_9BASI|nr:hypothetical protein PSTT_07772 [Puccinia striiformis]
MLRIPQPAKQTYLNKKTKNLVKQSRKARALYNTALLENDHVNLPGLRKSMEEKGRRVKVAIEKIATEDKLLRSARVNKTLVKNEGANFHRTVQTAQGKRLHTPRVWHQTQLVSPRTHVPKKNCGGPRKLLHIRQACDTLDEEEDGEVDGVALPNKLDAQAFLQAIRQIQRNSAPGKSGVLAIHLKKFLEVECQLQISKDWKDPEMDWYGDKCYPKPIDHSVVAIDRWHLPEELMTPLLIHLLNIMRACIRLKTQPALWNEEILITLPKPGQDPRWLKNTRGITLSCTEGKLLLTIVAIEIATKLEIRKFFSKAQAGFRSGQEAIAQVIALNEAIRRRLNMDDPTQILYIDFQKAFNRVPHEGLWAKMRSIGIHEDLIQIIRKGYDESLIQCRLGDNLSEPFTRKIGTRQGCPLSPLLFILFVNDILESITEGIEVPGLKEPVKGLLFADDTLIFADNKRQIESICKRLDKYCSKWHFALGYEKCGVVEYNPKLGAVLEHPTFQLAKGQIKSMDTYKYLGCFIPNKLEPKEEYVMENEHSKLLARKAENCMHASSALLHDQWIHLLAKTRIIQTYIMAAGTYGAEWIGMNQKRTRTIQSVIDRASRLAYGKKDNNQTLNTLLLSLELGITPVSIHCAVQRIRLWNKGEDLRTILKDLIEHPPQGPRTKSGSKIHLLTSQVMLTGSENGGLPHFIMMKAKHVVMDKQYAQQMHAEKIRIHLFDLEVARESKEAKLLPDMTKWHLGVQLTLLLPL